MLGFKAGATVSAEETIKAFEKLLVKVVIWNCNR